MAISATHYHLLKQLQPHLPRGGSLLEIGEANWYGDLAPSVMLELCGDEGIVPGWVLDAVTPGPHRNLFEVAKAFYHALFAPSRTVAVDINGTDKAWRCDLNKPAPPLGLFDVVMNNGTAEHVFNIAQVFISMHNACKVGGLMIHDAPFTGWVDHGFYCLQPTLFYDLAAVNLYELVNVSVMELRSRRIIPIESRERIAEVAKAGGLPDNAMLFVAMRKTSAEPFKVPMQGYYDGRLSDDGKRAWETLR
jgi:hypothetical protein